MRWIFSVVPINMAVGPVGIFAQLYIPQHRSVLDIGVATTLFNAVTIPGAIFWGIVTDRVHTRKALVAFSYVAVAAVLFAFLLVGTIYGVEIVHAVFSFLSIAFATLPNLLIMKTQPKASWASAFARFSMVSSIGTTLGLVIGVGWGDFLPFQLLVGPLSVLSLISAVLTVRMIKEPVLGLRSVYDRDDPPQLLSSIPSLTNAVQARHLYQAENSDNLVRVQ